MTFQKGHDYGRTSSRKGIPNKLTIDVRQKFYKVYEKMSEDETVSGDDAFISWGRKNPNLFYTLFAKLLPKTIDGDLTLRKHESFVESLSMEQLIGEAQAKIVETPAGIPHVVLDTPKAGDSPVDIKPDTPKSIHNNEIKEETNTT